MRVCCLVFLAILKAAAVANPGSVAGGGPAGGPILYCSPSQINFQTRVSLATGPASLQIIRDGTPLTALNILVGDAIPAVFVADAARSSPRARSQVS